MSGFKGSNGGDIDLRGSIGYVGLISVVKIRIRGDS